MATKSQIMPSFTRRRLTLLEEAMKWFGISTLMFFEFISDGIIIEHLFAESFPRIMIATLKLCVTLGVSIAFLNTIYYIVQYFRQILARSTQQKSASAPTNKSLTNMSYSLPDEKNDAVLKLCSFLDKFFKSALSKPSPTSTSADMTRTGEESSLSATLGYRDSPLNRSISSVYTRQQLQEMNLSHERDTIIDSTNGSVFITSNYTYDEDRPYRAGVPLTIPNKTEEALEEVKSFFNNMPKKKTASEIGLKVSSDSFQSKYPDMSGADSTGGRSPIRTECDALKIFKRYDINEYRLDEYELKLRIWICNTILRPLAQKIDEMNDILSKKYSVLHLKIGSTAPDVLQSALLSKSELCNTLLPFLLPYLRIHSNQNYVVHRIRELSENIALEKFKWNSGGAETIYDEKTGVTRKINWNEQLPTDSEFVWYCFSAYFDYQMSARSLLTSDMLRPFSSKYFLDATVDSRSMDTSMLDSFFIRLASKQPPVFEFVVHNGSEVLVPNKETGNFWVVMLLLIAHVFRHDKHARIGNLSLSAISLNVFE
ncbi:transmembrane protein [Ditylenchus destructor]|nr:transmembrane protein [Ditylenchus destructor]